MLIGYRVTQDGTTMGRNQTDGVANDQVEWEKPASATEIFKIGDVGCEVWMEN